MTVNHYAMSHAAASASLYSYGASYYPITNTSYVGNVADTDTDAFTRTLGYSSYQGSTALGYNGFVGQISGNIVNFYDETDSAIGSAWNLNNSTFKPQLLLLGLTGEYAYAPSNSSGQKLYLQTPGYISANYRYVTDPSEAKAYVDQSLTGTIGSNTALKGAVPANVSEDAMGDDHGYEWNNPLQDPTTFSFYNSLMGTYDITPISTP